MNWQVTYREWLERYRAPGAVAMTESEWQRCPLSAVMLRFLYAYPNGRKRRLFAVACLRRALASIPPNFLPFVEIAEDYAEGRIDADALREAWSCAGWMYDGDEDLLEEGETAPCEFDDTLTEADRRFANAVYRALEAPACYDHPDQWSLNDAAGWAAEGIADAISFLPEKRTWDEVTLWKERAAQADLLREIYGNPFRPIVFDPGWRSPEVMHLAETIYKTGAFERMPSLFGALRTAGCQEGVILAHCHSNHPHVRGCWLLDLILNEHR